MLVLNALYSLDIFAFGTFAVSYYRNCYRKGYRMDFWHAQLVIFCVVPYMLMLPFASNPLNALVVGRDFNGVVAATSVVFPMAMLGYFSLLLGGSLWRLQLGVGIRRTVARALDVVPRGSMLLMSSRELMIFLSAICFAAQLLLLGIYFSAEGFGFNLRSYTFTNPGIRPIAQIIALSSTIIAAHCLARYLERKERSILASACLLLLGLLFFGQRGNIIYAGLNGALCYVIQRRDTISLFRILVGGTFAVTLILYLGSVRDGEYSPLAFLASLAFLVFFGNNLCDLRDFAWIYSRWDHQLWMGKTYVAGLMTFLPRSVSEFRGEWTFGVATGRTVGLDTELHPGLKPGQFGEAFFNFGVPGIILFGLLMGILIWRADYGIKEAFRSRQPSLMRAFAYTSLISLAACLNTSAALPGLYALFGLFFLAWLYLRARVLVIPRRALVAELS
ncbi:hypothetical protein [Terriglobus sp.]|uniref:hypothetical protein n=1 Tax=Terriglobus sp. TaxID=1889013 RepID=UPI003B00E9F1